jgi:predicted transcriptional regulator
MPDAKIVVRVEPSLKRVCERIAESKDETLSQVLRRALRQYAEANKSAPRARRKG